MVETIIPILAISITILGIITGYVSYLLRQERSKTTFKVGTEYNLESITSDLNNLKKEFRNEIVTTKEEHTKMQQLYNEDLEKMQKDYNESLKRLDDRLDSLSRDLHELKGFIRGRSSG